VILDCPPGLTETADQVMRAAVESWLTSLVVSISGHDVESAVDLFAQGVDR
jgi:hypothetical protein